MRSPELFLGSVRRSLFPPMDLRKLRFRGGWAGLPIYLVFVVIGWFSIEAFLVLVLLAAVLYLLPTPDMDA